MIGFLNRLFGGVENGASSNAAEGLNNMPDSRGASIENRNLKFRRLYQAIENDIGRELERHEKQLVDHSLDNNIDQKRFDDLSGEGLLVYAREIAKTFGWDSKRSNGWTPGKDIFSPMESMGGNVRQVNFEQGLMDYLGRPPSDQELAQARAAFLRAEDAERKRFNNMVGEEANDYARKLAADLKWKPASSVSGESGEEAVAAK